MYGLIITAGIFIASWYAEKEAIHNKKDPDTIWGALLWLLIFGIIGARLFHVIDYWSYYSLNPVLIPQIYRGGLGIFGGILGGSVGLVIYCLKNKFTKKELLELFDITARALPLGQFIGRWANFFNNELYGLPSKLPWSIYIPPEKRLEGYINYSTYHPLFLYESIGSIFIFFILFIFKYKLKNKVKLLDGDLFLLYLLSYSILRFTLEPLRLTHWVVNGFNVIQLICIALALTSFLILLFRKEK